MNNPRHKLIAKMKAGQMAEKDVRTALAEIVKLENNQPVAWFATSLIWYAIECKSDLLVKALIEKKADLSYRSTVGRTLLHLATEVESLASVDVLVERGIGSILDVQDCDGMTALHAAARYNSVPLVKRLVEAGADPNILDVNGRTCMHEAILAGNMKLGEWLLYKGAYKNRWVSTVLKS